MPNLTTRDGRTTGGVFGFASLALELIKQIDPDFVAVAWDKKGTNIRRRREIFSEYKANRHAAPPEFYAQIPLLREMLDALNWPLYECDDYEADDIIGTFSHRAAQENLRVIMISSDLDLLQLIQPSVELFALKKGLANLEKFDEIAFEKKYHIKVAQFLDLKSLKGDASDNIPGVAGVGEKTAEKLLQDFGTLENIYENLNSEKIRENLRQKLIAGCDSAFMSKKLAQIWLDAPVELDLEKMNARNLDTEKLREKLLEFEFNSLIPRLPDYMKSDENVQQKIAMREKIFDKTAREILENAPEIVALFAEKNRDNVVENLRENSAKNSPQNREILLSSDEKNFYRIAEKTAREILQNKKIITHDAKLFSEKILENADEKALNFSVEFDTKLAGFLLDSSRKVIELDAENSENDGEKLTQIWQLYRAQKNEFSRHEKLKKLAKKTDFPLQILLAKIEKRGVKLDEKIFADMLEKIAREVKKLDAEIQDFVGKKFNVASPVQLSEALFDDLKLPTNGIKKTARGFSTGAKELAKLRPFSPVIEKIETWRKLAKLKNTYLEPLPKLVDESGFLHTNFRQDVTATGRLSSSDPNLQNIPTRGDIGREIRRAFVAPPGKILVNADYAQFELRLAAELAHDQEMIEIFNDGKIDVHTATAAANFGIEPEKVTPMQRRAAKVINFGVLYGMSAHSLAQTTGMDYSSAKNFIERYFAARQPIRDFLDQTIKQASEKGYVETLFGRRRPTPDVRAGNFAIRAAAERAAANMPIQGTEADLMKAAMLKIEREIPEAQQILQVHDSIMVQTTPQNAQNVGEKMREIMENICPALAVKLKVDVKIGANWGEV